MNSVKGTPSTLWHSATRIGLVWPATIALFAISPLIAARSLDGPALMTMLPLAGVLALIAVGQGLVIQQRGIDLSIPGIMSLSGLVLTQFAAQYGTVLAIVFAVGAAALGGLANGLVVTKLHITPIVATLAVNALLLGVVQFYSGGIASSAPTGLTQLALSNTVGLPNVFLLALAILASVAIVNRRTMIGRRLTQAGKSPAALKVIGGNVPGITCGSYVISAILYGIAAVLLTAYLQTPGLDLGTDQLLPSVAAVVLAGNALTGGDLKVWSIAAAALFLTQLDQLVLSTGAPNSVQLLIQAAVLLVAVSMPLLRRVSIRRAQRRGDAGSAGEAAPPFTGSREKETAV